MNELSDYIKTDKKAIPTNELIGFLRLFVEDVAKDEDVLERSGEILVIVKCIEELLIIQHRKFNDTNRR